MHCTPDGGGWGDGDGKVEYKLHFYARLSKPMTDYGFWSADIPEGASRHRNDVDSLPYLENIAKSEIITGKDEITGKHIGFYTEFPTVKGETVDLKVGVSFVDLEGAEKNFMAEIDGKDFTTVREEAFDMWNNALGRVRIDGGTADEKTVFYTSLYHTMIDPRITTDVDGRYVAGDKSIRQGDGNYTRRTISAAGTCSAASSPCRPLSTRALSAMWSIRLCRWPMKPGMNISSAGSCSIPTPGV